MLLHLHVFLLLSNGICKFELRNRNIFIMLDSALASTVLTYHIVPIYNHGIPFSIFCDLSKALLLIKSNCYGIKVEALDLIYNYVTNR